MFKVKSGFVHLFEKKIGVKKLKESIQTLRYYKLANFHIFKSFNFLNTYLSVFANLIFCKVSLSFLFERGKKTYFIHTIKYIKQKVLKGI